METLLSVDSHQLITWGYTEGDAPAAESPRFVIHVLSEGGRVASVFRSHVINGSCTVGRSVEAENLKLDDRRASREHARFRVQLGQLWLKDMSRNGTFVNGAPIDEVTLAYGDLIRIGDSCLLIGPPDESTAEDHLIDGLLGRTPAMRQLRRTVSRAAPTNTTVLIQGESGTGKEVIARALHALSQRSGAFIAVNCSAIPEGLVESQLFGHLAGSFTGANTNKEGLFAAADKGTLFLDELADLPQNLQPKLLRVLEERAIVPVGATTSRSIDVRVVAATHHDVKAAVADGRFRGDLYARLAEITIQSDPLRKRRLDILPLLFHFLKDTPELTPDLTETLLIHSWPFNVRELRSVAKQLQVFGAKEGPLDLSSVDDRLSRPRARSTTPVPSSGERSVAPRNEEPTRARLIELLQAHQGNISRISRELSYSRRQIHRFIEKYGLNVDDFR